jgi:6-phosphogluconate dehydrogenase
MGTALDLGVPVTGIAEAVFARALSGSVAQRKASTGLASGELGEKPSDATKFIEDVRRALYASKIIAYAQGFNQIQAGSDEYDWNITPGDMATIWRGGCIIRAKFLNRIKEAFDQDPTLPSLIVAPYFRSAIEGSVDSWRRVVVTATELGIPIPGFSSSLSYYDALRTARLPAALTQACGTSSAHTPTAASTPIRPNGSTPCGAGITPKCWHKSRIHFDRRY